MELILSSKEIQERIHLIRNEHVILDSDLAQFYQMDTKLLKQTVRRNIERFPDEFMFELTQDEFKSLQHYLNSLIGEKRGGIRYMPFVFTALA